MTNSLFIDGQWLAADGAAFSSASPGTGKIIWSGGAASTEQIDAAVDAAKKAASSWFEIGYDAREQIVKKFASQVEDNQDDMARMIAMETGKPLWEAKTEAAAMKGKIPLSIKAFKERTSISENDLPGGKAVIRYKPHGVVAVFGPYNFPGHLPNGHIVPALLAGNTVIFKPSELTPAVAEFTVKLWEQAGIPKGVINLVQGEQETGIALAAHAGLNGLFFTGSSNTGKLIHKQYGGQPDKILALEMGGNNPLVVDEVQDTRAAVHDTIHSAFITAGQRCTCARRLFVPETQWGDEFLEQLINAAKNIQIGLWDDDPQPFMGSLISEKAAIHLLDAQTALKTSGANVLLEAAHLKEGTGLLSPGLIDVTSLENIPDEEYFGPLLQIVRYKQLDDAFVEANNTRFGLSAGLFSDSREHYEQFLQVVEAGIVNWNRPITGASGSAPFGGPGESGNHRPSAYFAADYCSYPVASVEAEQLQMPEKLAPGLKL